MDSGVGAAGAADADGPFPLNASERFLQNTLNGAQARLHLPPGKVGTVVREIDANASRGRNHASPAEKRIRPALVSRLAVPPSGIVHLPGA